MNKPESPVLRYSRPGALISLSVCVVLSQLSVALSSIGLGALIILGTITLIIRGEEHYTERTLMYLFLAFILAQILSSAFSLNPGESFFIFLRRDTIFAVFFSVFLFIDNFNELKKILAVLFIFTTLISSYEIVRYFMDFTSQNTVPLSEFRIEYFGYPITNGQIKMLILLLITSFILLKDRPILNRAALVILAIPVLLSLYLTNSRNSILGLTAGLIVIGALKNRKFLAGMVLAIIIFLAAAPLPVKERIISIADPNHPTVVSRIVMWKTGVEIFKDRPVFGIGDIDQHQVYPMYKKIELHGEGTHMHSNFFQLLVSLGLFGLSSWIALMAYIIYRQAKIYVKVSSNKVLSTIAAASMSSMAAFQVSGLTEWNFGDFEFAVVMWFTLGLAFAAEKFSENTAENKTFGNR